MSNFVNQVPAVQLDRSADFDSWSRGGVSLTLSGLLAAPLRESIVIPIEREFTSKRFLVEYCMRCSSPVSRLESHQQSKAGPLVVLLRDRTSEIATLWLGPGGTCWTGPGVTALDSFIYFAYEPVPEQRLTQWMRVVVELTENNLNATLSSVSGEQLGNYNRYSSTVLQRSQYARWAEVFDMPYIVALVIGSSLLDRFTVADIRLWSEYVGGPWRYVDKLRNRRLVGRERGLLGYWRLAEGQGAELQDSSRTGKAGKLTGGVWLSPDESGLALDCTFEEAQRVRDEVISKKYECNSTATATAGLRQETELLSAKILALQDQQRTLAESARAELEKLDSQLRELETRYRDWQDDTRQGGRVALDTFSKTVADEVDQASQRLDEATSLYSLQGVDLEVKMLPVQTAEEEDFRVVFPAIDDPNVQSDQLSTLSLNFTTRLKTPDRPEGIIPDVTGYTEVGARRKLAQAGFRAEVLDEAVASEEELGRVRVQVPEPNSERPLDSIVTLVVGRTGGIALAGGTTSGKV